MRKYLHLLLLLLLCSLPYGLFADVVLTDEQALELDQTIDQLGNILNQQQEEIATLKQQNEEMQTSSENKQKLLNEQNEEIKMLKSSYRKRNLFSLMHDILISLGMGLIGFVIGILFF